MDLIVLPEYSDAPADVQGKAGFYGAPLFRDGIDTVLTNDYLAVENAVKDYLPK